MGRSERILVMAFSIQEGLPARALLAFVDRDEVREAARLAEELPPLGAFSIVVSGRRSYFIHVPSFYPLRSDGLYVFSAPNFRLINTVGLGEWISIYQRSNRRFLHKAYYPANGKHLMTFGPFGTIALYPLTFGP